MNYKSKSTKWLERQINKMKEELNYRDNIPFPQALDIDERDSRKLASAIVTFINHVWNNHPAAFSEDSFREIFIEALKVYYGPDIWEKIKIKAESSGTVKD